MLREQNPDSEFIYDAFISYRHVSPDKEIAQSLHRMLENYKVPGWLVKRGAPVKLNKIFRDREELPTSSDLDIDIQEALKRSRFLIVVCSPDTPDSKWVAREIQMFKEFHGDDNVLAVLVSGEPKDSFPVQLVKRAKITVGKTEDIEPLASDIRAKSMKESLKLLKTEKLRLLARLLNCRYDDLKQRELERTIKRIVTVAAAAVVFFAALGIFIFFQLRIVTYERNEAQKARVLAQKNELEAIKQKGIAVEQMKLAEEERNKAILSAKIAEEQRLLAKQNEQEAITQKNIADKERNNALMMQSKVLATLSRSQAESGGRIQAAALALQALPGSLNKRDIPYVKEAEDALFYSCYTYPYNTSLAYQYDKSVTDYGYFTDNRRFFVCFDNELDIYDRYTGNMISSFKTKSYDIKIVAVSPKGNCVVLESGNRGSGTIASLWDIEKNIKIKDLLTTTDYSFYNYYYSNFNGLLDAVFSSDGSMVCAFNTYMDENDKIYIRDTRKGNVMYPVTGPFEDIKFTGSGDLQIQNSNVLKRYDKKGNEKLSLNLSERDYGCIDDYGTEAALAGSTKAEGKSIWSVNIYNINTMKELRKVAIKGSWSGVKVLRYDTKGGMLYISARGDSGKIDSAETLITINISTGQETVMKGINDFSFISSGIFSSDRKNILIKQKDAAIKVLDLEYSKNAVLVSDIDNEYVKYSRDGSCFYAAKDSGKVEKIDSSSGKLLKTFTGHGDSVQSISEDTQGLRIATTSFNDHSVRIWNAKTGSLLKTIACPDTENFLAAVFSPDGKYLATQGNDIKLWDGKTFRLIKNLTRGKTIFKFTTLQNRCISFDSSGKRLLAISYDDSVKSDPKQVVNVWNIDKDKLLFSLREDNPTSGFDNAVFICNDKYIMTTANNHLIFWNASNGKKVKDIYADGFISDVIELSTDSKKAAIYTGQNISVIDLQTLEIAKTIKTNSQVYSLSFSTDCKRLMVSFEDEIDVWDIRDGANILKQKIYHDEEELNYARAYFNPKGDSMLIYTQDGVLIQPYFSNTQGLVEYAEDQLKP